MRVDGIRDLVNDINDGVLAQEVMEELLHLATERNCCIVCVLHQNKGSEDHNLRGWIGTELMNKAFEAMYFYILDVVWLLLMTFLSAILFQYLRGISSSTRDNIRLHTICCWKK